MLSTRLVIDSMLVYNFVDAGPRFEIFFEKWVQQKMGELILK